MLKAIKKNNYHIGKNSVKKIANQIGWKGSGAQDDPYIIEKVNHYPINLTFTANDAHILLKTQHFTRLSLIRCQNIVIDNCTISLLHIEGCKSITVRNSRLLRIRLILSRGNTFENNEILRESYDRLLKNKYDKWIIALMLFVTGFGTFFVASSIMGFVSTNHVLYSIIYLTSGILALYLAANYFQIKLKMKKFPPNTFSNFNIVSFTDAKVHFAKLIDLKR